MNFESGNKGLYPKLAKIVVPVELSCGNYHDFVIISIVEFWTKYIFFIWRYLKNNYIIYVVLRFVFHIFQRDSSIFLDFRQANCYNIYLRYRSQFPISHWPNFVKNWLSVHYIYLALLKLISRHRLIWCCNDCGQNNAGPIWNAIWEYLNATGSEV